MVSFRFQITHDLLGIGGLLFVTGLILAVHGTPILLTDYGPLSLSASRLFNAGITIIAAMFTDFIGARIRNGLMRSLESRLRDIGEILKANQCGNLDKNVALRKIDRQWRGVLGIDSVLEKPGNGLTFFIFLLCGLTTAAIVTALAPSMTERVVPYQAILPDTELGVYSNQSNRSCFGILPDDAVTRGTYSWNFPNGTAFFSTVDGGCPPASVMTLSNGINTEDPDDYAYSVSGIGIERTAIGVPTTIFKSSALATFSRNYGLSLMSTRQCVPVMVSNPVRCEKGGEVEMLDEHHLSVRPGTTVGGVSIDDIKFNNTGRFPIRNLSVDSVMVTHLYAATFMNGKLWPADDDAYPAGGIGPGLVFFGARNDPLGHTPFASPLAGTINDPNTTVGTGGNETYAVTCVIDARNSFDYRIVSLDLRAIDRQGSTLARYVSGGEHCTPATPTISNKMFAVAVTASHDIIEENWGSSGYFTTIATLAGFNRGPPYAFPDSHNALEDVLGLIAALGVSQIPVVGPGASADSKNGSAVAIVQAKRLGTDKQEVLALLTPLLGSIFILASLFFLSFREDWKPGGEEFRNKSLSQRPQRYAAESICQLVSLRMRNGALFEEIPSRPKAGPAVINTEEIQEP